jgi:sugar O-acyltransferase (sialic acid O-acetyltransferase NeuD family)
MKLIFLGAANPEAGRMIRALERSNAHFEAVGFIDNDPAKKNTTFLGLPVFGGFEVLDQLNKDENLFVNLITGSTRTRYETSLHLRRSGCRFGSFLHPSIDFTMTRIGVGNYLQEGVVLQAEVELGSNSSIHMGTLVGHESKIGHSVFIAHAVSISGSVTIGDGAFIGTNATVLPRLTIGRWATIGAGAVITRDVPDYAVVVGNPGKVLRINDSIHSSGDIFRDPP